MTAGPLLFMNVSGLARKMLFVPILPLPKMLSNCVWTNGTFDAAAKRSSTMKPMLCLVSRYFSPGLPRPTMQNTLSVHRYPFTVVRKNSWESSLSDLKSSFWQVTVIAYSVSPVPGAERPGISRKSQVSTTDQEPNIT